MAESRLGNAGHSPSDYQAEPMIYIKRMDNRRS